MIWRDVPKRATAAVHALCASGLPGEVLIPTLLEALHDLIPSDRNLFDWTDDEGQLLNYFIEGPVDTEVARLYFEQFHNHKEADCMPAFASLRGAPAGVRAARELNHAGFFDSALYNEVWRPQGMHTRIEGVVRSGKGRLLGSLVLYRGPHDRPFTSTEERTLESILPALARSLERCRQPASAPLTDRLHVRGREPSETVLLDFSGRVLHTSPGAERLLMLADGGLSRDALARSVTDHLDRLFGSLLNRLRERVEFGHACTPKPWPSSSMFNAYGRFDAQSSLLCSPGAAQHAERGLLQIVLLRLEPREVAVQRVLRELPISLGQASVCAALYAGQTQTEVARDLGVAASTVVDHVRKLYRALGVCGAAELRELLDRRIAAAAP